MEHSSSSSSGRGLLSIINVNRIELAKKISVKKKGDFCIVPSSTQIRIMGSFFDFNENLRKQINPLTCNASAKAKQKNVVLESKQ